MSRRSRKHRPARPPTPARSATAAAAHFTAADVEPEVQRDAPPVWVLAMLALLLFWADMYVLDHGADVMGKAGSFPTVVYDPFRTAAEVDALQPKSDADLILAKGRRLYEASCAPCHQSTGQGNPANNIPPLAGSEWVLTPGPGRITRIVLNSVRGPISVKGVTYDNPGMPPWRDAIPSDEDVAALLSYVRANKDWGHNAPLVKPEQVKQIRDATAAKGEPWTAPELLQISETE
jgi:mono/diheme cytochrome c family protein